MAKKPKPPALRNLSSELGSIGQYSTAAFNERSPALLTSATRGTNQLARTATNARQRELSTLQNWAFQNVSPTSQAVRGEYDAITTRLGAPSALEGIMTNSAAQALENVPSALEGIMINSATQALQNPTAGNRVLGALETEAMGGDSEILRNLQSQALSDLNLGRSLSPEQEMQAQQAARAGFAARGMGVGQPAAAAEILNRDAFATQRQDQRRGFGMNVENLGNQSKQFRLGVSGQTQNAINSGRQFALGTNAQTLQREGMRAEAATRTADFNFRSSPAMIALSQQSMVPQAMSTASQLTSQADVYPQLLQYGSDYYNTNFNARESRYLSDMNRFYAGQYGGFGAGPGGGNAAMGTAIGSAGGMLAGAAAGAAMGSVVPGFGTLVGGAAGALMAGGSLGAGVGGAAGGAIGGAIR